jgi:hypothetical protein
VFVRCQLARQPACLPLVGCQARRQGRSLDGIFRICIGVGVVWVPGWATRLPTDLRLTRRCASVFSGADALLCLGLGELGQGLDIEQELFTGLSVDKPVAGRRLIGNVVASTMN